LRSFPRIPAFARTGAEIQQRIAWVPACELVKLLQLSLARNYPLSSLRRRGPIATDLSISRRPHHIATTRRIGPRLRGDDSGRFIASHILARGRTASKSIPFEHRDDYIAAISMSPSGTTSRAGALLRLVTALEATIVRCCAKAS